jgi:MFS family permease
MTYLGTTHARTELHGTATLAAVATLIAVAFGLSTLLTPLYIMYKQAFGFSQITLTLVYAVYVIGNIAALLFLGRVSDCAGRRLMALSAIAILIVAALVLLFADSIAALYAGRILTGLGIGIASGTGNAWLVDLLEARHKRRAATIGTATNFLGLGLAPLLSGLLAQYAPWPLHLSFVVYLVLLGAAGALVWFTQETVRPQRWARIDFRPRLSVPAGIRAQFVAPAITGFGLMALVGFYSALMPVILSQDLHIESHAAAGALFFELAGVVAAVIVASEPLNSSTAMLSSLALMIPAAAATVAAQVTASLAVMVAATALVGVAAGFGYRGSLQVVNRIAPETKRAAVVSSYFVCCFIGNALPVIGVGVLSSLVGATVADSAFAGMIIVFALVALWFGARYRR